MLHERVCKSNSNVRDAVETSVTNLPVNRAMIQVSVVVMTPLDTRSLNQTIFGATKYGSRAKPLLANIKSE